MERRITVRHGWKLSDRIRQARQAIGLSRADLARRIGVSPSAAVQWEHPNGTSPCIKYLIEIARITDVAFEWLATGRGSVRLRDGGEETSALRLEAIAQDLFEEQILVLARRIRLSHREALVHYLRAVYEP